MNTDVNILNKISANQIQLPINSIIHHDKVRFILRMQNCFNIKKSINVFQPINKLEKKNYTIINIYRKVIRQNPALVSAKKNK